MRALLLAALSRRRERRSWTRRTNEESGRARARLNPELETQRSNGSRFSRVAAHAEYYRTWDPAGCAATSAASVC